MQRIVHKLNVLQLGCVVHNTCVCIYMCVLLSCSAPPSRFVVDENTRSIASMIEASEHITAQTSDVVLVMKDMAVGTLVNGEPITPSECKDLNRGRAYLADVAHRHLQSGVFSNVKDAVSYIIKKLKRNRASQGMAGDGMWMLHGLSLWHDMYIVRHGC